MSRSGYRDDCENLGLWRNAVERAAQGKRGQAFLREMLAALDAMPVKELVAEDMVRDEEHVCGLGAVAVSRRLDVSKLDVNDGNAVGALFGIAPALALEIAYENDEAELHRSGRMESPAERWRRMRYWVARHLVLT
jgi:hypothetical protein